METPRSTGLLATDSLDPTDITRTRSRSKSAYAIFEHGPTSSETSTPTGSKELITAEMPSVAVSSPFGAYYVKKNSDSLTTGHKETKCTLDVPNHQRAKSIGSMPKFITDAFNKLEEKRNTNRDKQFHKLFTSIPSDEPLIRSFSCALVRDLLIQGRMFISAKWVCFYANIFGYETQLSIAVSSIQSIRKMKTVYVIPNAIKIQTDTEKYLFGSLMSRRTTYKKLMEVWNQPDLNDEDKSTISHGDSCSHDGNESPMDDQGSQCEETVDSLQRASSSKYSRPAASDVTDNSSGKNTQPVGSRSFLKNTIMRVQRIPKRISSMHLIMPLVLVVIFCLSISSVVLRYRITQLQSQLEIVPRLQEAMVWNEILLTSQSGHIEEVSKIGDSILHSLQVLNQMHSSLQLLQNSAIPRDDPIHI